MSLLLAVVMCVGLAVSALAFEVVCEDEDPLGTYDLASTPEGYDDPSWSYQYGTSEYGFKKLIGAFYQGAYYTYVYDNAGVIEGMLDADGNQIVKYEYDQHGLVASTYSNENGKWVRNENPDFIGNKNKMLSSGMFYDEVTNCYYANGRYFSPVLNKYMDGTDDHSVLVNTNPYLHMEDGIMPIDDSVVVDELVTLWANELLESSNYGCPITQYSSDWYSSLSDVEVVARAIYCEGGVSYTNEENAVGRVILNRIHAADFPDTPAGVVKESGQFESITGSEQRTVNARNPETDSPLWKHSTYLACFLLSTTNKTHWNRVVGDPITDQLGFFSYSYAKGRTIFHDSGSKLMYYSKEIKNVYVVGYGSVKSFGTLFSNYSPTPWSRNIYYNYV